MKKEINVLQLMKDSKSKGVPLYELIKRELLYRDSKDSDLGRACKNCRASHKILYKDGFHLQCSWIGIIKDDYSDIKLNSVCKFYERAIDKNLDDEGVVYEKEI